MSTTSIFFNQSFDKKRLKTFLYWIFKTFGEKEALIVVEQLKSMGFSNATKAGLSIGLHDLKTPDKKKVLISHAQLAMRKTEQEFQGAEVTATERSQRIVDTWHRTSEDLRKQVVDYFSTYDQLNSVYMMALSGARGNFSQVRQLIGMRGLMADPQGQIISFPIRSNLREGLTLTEYFISCSGARKGLVDTALRTADTGYLTRRLVDISHHIVIKKVTCYTSRGIALKTLRTPQKVLLALRERLVGRVLAENIYSQKNNALDLEQRDLEPGFQRENQVTKTKFLQLPSRVDKNQRDKTKGSTRLAQIPKQAGRENQRRKVVATKNQEISPDLALQISLAKENIFLQEQVTRSSDTIESQNKRLITKNKSVIKWSQEPSLHTMSKTQHVRKDNSLQGIRVLTDPSDAQVLVRSPLTCTYTHELCQLCYGWSMAQGSLVSLGEAVGVIAGQSIGEPGTQLTMRTFHTGGVFSGDLLQEIRAPHSGKIVFPKALQGLLIRTSQGKIAFLIKVSGEVIVESSNIDDPVATSKTTRLQLAPSTILFVRQGERVKGHQVLAELAIATEQGNQPIKSRQTLFSEMGGRVVQWRSMTARVHRTKGVLKEIKRNPLPLLGTAPQTEPRSSLNSNKGGLPYQLAVDLSQNQGTRIRTESGIKAYLGPVEVEQSFAFLRNTESNTLQQLAERNAQRYSETWDSVNNITLQKIASAKKHGLGSIEPPQALKLGLLGVIATRVGASEKTCTKSVRSNQTVTSVSALRRSVTKTKLNTPTGFHRTNKNHAFLQAFTEIDARHSIDSNTQITRLQHLNTIAEQGDLVDDNYTQL